MRHRSRPFRNVQQRTSRSGGRQRGLTLYEVILSLAILLPAMVVLTQGISTGSRAAVQARLQTDAILRCDSLLSEVIVGARPLTSVSQMSFDDGAEGWTWSMDVASSALHPDMLTIAVTVEHADMSGMTNASWSLTRTIRDPALFGAAIDASMDSTGVLP